MLSRTSTRVAALAAAALVAVSSTVAAEPASAGALGSFVASNVRIRSTPWLNSPAVYGLGQIGQRVCVYGSANGAYVTDMGHTTNKWLYLKDLTTGIGPGWVWEWYISGTLQYNAC